jgi:hypothetical protein
VVEIVASIQANPLVRLTSPLGGLVGEWRGSSEPVVGVEYDFEVEIEEVLTWGGEAVTTEGIDAGLRQDGEITLISGVLRSVFPDGVVWIALNDGGLQVATTGVPPPLGTGVSLRARRLAIFDANT